MAARERTPPSKNEFADQTLVDPGNIRAAAAPDEDEVRLDSAEVTAWLEGAQARRGDDLRPDSRADIAARLDDDSPVNPEWTLEGFLERLDGLIAQEHPPENVVLVVTHWLLSRLDDPYLGMEREPGFPQLVVRASPRISAWSRTGGGVLILDRGVHPDGAV